MSKVQYVMNNEGDWCGLYVDGQLLQEGHEIYPDVFIELLGGESFYDEDGQFGEYLGEFGGRFPQDWTEVEKKLANVGPTP